MKPLAERPVRETQMSGVWAQNTHVGKTTTEKYNNCTQLISLNIERNVLPVSEQSYGEPAIIYHTCVVNMSIHVHFNV